MPSKPQLDPRADVHFRELARSLGRDPDNAWVGGYVDYEWSHGRHIYETYDPHLAGKRYLEFGCNYGATSIVLTALGADVVGLDVDMSALRIARANARRYGLGHILPFILGSTEARLPFPSETFDRVVCNSVLEYVAAESLPAYQRELDRVLKPGGLIFISGTSNRLAPREIHSQRWLVNYVPRWMDKRFAARSPPLVRGVSPWQVRLGFGVYENLDRSDGGRAYLQSRALITPQGSHSHARKLAHVAASLFGVSLGLLTPSLAVVLRKPEATLHAPRR